MSAPIEPLPARLRRLREERNLSRSLLSRATVGHDGTGVAEVTIKFLESGTRQPGLDTIEAVAYGLGVEPEEFPEYRLALARRQLDERAVGLNQAVATLTLIEAALPTPGRRRRAAARAADTPKPSGASRPSRKTRPAG